jgi:hypothetical protein
LQLAGIAGIVRHRQEAQAALVVHVCLGRRTRANQYSPSWRMAAMN